MDVVVIGSCMTDLVSYVSRLPKPGETLHGDKFTVGFGGKGANQCVVASRLGATSAMVAKVGNDTFGHNTIANFKSNQINVAHVGITDGAATGVAQITVNAEGQNSIVIVSGANLLLTEQDVVKAESVIASARVVLCQLEICPDVTLAAMKLARKHNVTTILNPAPAQSNLDTEFYTNCDIFCPNETEAELLTGKPIATVSDAERVAGVFIERGCRTVIITLGVLGSVIVTRDQPTAVHIPARPVTAVDSTGAGDAFVGSLAYYLAKLPSLPLCEAVKRSSEIATLSVQTAGTQTSYPWSRDLPNELLTFVHEQVAA